MKQHLSTVITLAGLLFLAGAAQADDKKDPFEAYAKAGQPGPMHKLLEPMLGDWTFTMTFWPEPGAAAMESAGTAKRKWILDGRFLADEIDSTFAGQKFTGYGLTGYDNTQKKYVGNWVDSMSSGISISTGTVDKAGKVFTFEREDFDPVSGKKVKGRDVIKIVDNDKHTMEMYKDEGGKEVKAMEIVFIRKNK